MSESAEKAAKPKAKDVDALLTEVTSTIKAPKAEPKKAAKAAPKKTVRVRQVRSGICAPKDQKAALVGLGLRRIRHEVVLSDSASVRGQIHKVRHLVEVVGEGERK